MSLVRAEDRGHVRHLVIDRAEKRNAFNGEVVRDLDEAFRDAAADRDVRCVVLRGEGPMFSSGMDLSDLRALSESPELLRPFRTEVVRAWNRLEEMPKPTVCQIHGACIGGAMELALACDLRTIAADALIGIPEARVGLVPDVGGCSRLPSVVGLGRAKELIMTGRLIDGAEAERIGLANRVAPADELDAATEELVQELLACAPAAVAKAKELCDMAAKPAFSATLAAEGIAQEALVDTEDFGEGTRAFFEKRTPEFAGR